MTLKIISFIFIISLAFGVATSTLSYEWAQPQKVGNGMVGYSRFSLDCFNRLWCVFDSSCTVKAAYYLDSSWSDPISVYAGPSASGVGGFDARRAKDGKLWVLTCEEGMPEYYTVLYYDGNIWSDTFIIAGFTYHHLAADSIGKVWVVFDEGEDYSIWCDVCEDTIWSGPYVVCSYPTYDQVTGSNITIDPNGIRWAGAIAHHYPIEQIFLCHSDSTGAWSDSLIMGPQVHSGWLTDILSDNNNNIWISWVDGNVDSIYTAYLDTNLNWSPYYHITQSSDRCNLAVDNENKIWIVYDKGNNFYYRVWNGFEWSPEDSIVPPPASTASNGAIFYDPVRDRIWISFKTGGNDIYTTWINPSSGKEEQHPTFDAEYLTPEIYPNPAKSFLAIRLPSSVDRQAFKIFDVSGKLVKVADVTSAQSHKQELRMSLKGINPGIYFLRLGKETKKFMVVK